MLRRLDRWMDEWMDSLEDENIPPRPVDATDRGSMPPAKSTTLPINTFHLPALLASQTLRFRAAVRQPADVQIRVVLRVCSTERLSLDFLRILSCSPSASFRLPHGIDGAEASAARNLFRDAGTRKREKQRASAAASATVECDRVQSGGTAATAAVSADS